MKGVWTNLRALGVIGMGALGGLAAGAATPAAAEWIIPEEEREVPNPVEPTADSIEIGHKLFRENCETCHGPAGLGDGPGARVLETRLPNLQDAEWAGQKTDGEWFYKIAVGKDPMVGYEDFLEEEEIWHVVNYVRSLSLAQAEARAAAAEEEPAAEEAGTETARAEPAEEEAPADEAEETEATEPPEEETAEETHAEEHEEEAHGEENAEEHGDEEHAAAAAGHGGDHGDGGPAAPAEPGAIANYESTHAKAPLIWTLVVSILVGGVFVLFQKMVPPPPAEEASAGGHGDDHGH